MKEKSRRVCMCPTCFFIWWVWSCGTYYIYVVLGKARLHAGRDEHHNNPCICCVYSMYHAVQPPFACKRLSLSRSFSVLHMIGWSFSGKPVNTQHTYCASFLISLAVFLFHNSVRQNEGMRKAAENKGSVVVSQSPADLFFCLVRVPHFILDTAQSVSQVDGCTVQYYIRRAHLTLLLLFSSLPCRLILPLHPPTPPPTHTPTHSALSPLPFAAGHLS